MFIDSTFFLVSSLEGQSYQSLVGACFHLCQFPRVDGKACAPTVRILSQDIFHFIDCWVVAHLVSIMTKMLLQRILVEKTGQYILGSFLQHEFYKCSNVVCGYFQTKKSLMTSLHASFFSICKVSPFLNCPFPVLKIPEKVLCQPLKSVVIRPGVSIQVWISLVSSLIWTFDIQTIVELIHHTNKAFRSVCPRVSCRGSGHNVPQII